MSAVKDLYTGEIISWVVSKTNDNPLVMKTIKAAIEANPGVTLILHSDRGFQYTSKEYVREVSKAGINDCINYYNNERYQWNLKSLIPLEYRNQAT